jgi:fatty-acyl-CoA synthase
MASLNYYRMFYNYLKLLVLKNKTLGKTAEEMAASRKDATFLLFEDERISFAEFNRRANRRANFFRERGVGKGDVVCLLMENRPEYLETVVGLSKLGAITAGINYNLMGRALVHSLRTSGGGKAIVGAECLNTFREAMAEEQCVPPEEVYVDTRWEADAQPPASSQNLNELLAAASEENPPAPPLNSSDLFMYIYTSGTTGLPKAARISHLRWYGAGLAFGWYAWEVRAEDIIYCALPLYHSNGALIAFGAALRNGAALAISRRFSAGKFWEEAHTFGATCFIYIGEVLRYLVNSPPGPYDRDHKVTRVLGNGLRPDIWTVFQERFGIAHIREFYASTEGNAYTFNLTDTAGSVGKSLITPSNLFLVRYDVEGEDYIRDEHGFCQPCPPEEVGELLGQIKSTTPFGGYTNSADTEKKLLRDVFKKGDVFFKTGDLMKQDAQGNFYFIDRIGDTFRWKGENVSTHEVAEILAQFPGAAFVNVYGVEVPGMEGRVGMAAVTMEGGRQFDPKAFYQFAEEKLPSYSRPAFVRVKPEIEVTGTFKMTKTELKKTGYNPEVCSDPLFFRSPEGEAFVPLEQSLFDKIQAGETLL